MDYVVGLLLVSNKRSDKNMVSFREKATIVEVMGGMLV